MFSFTVNASGNSNVVHIHIDPVAGRGELYKQLYDWFSERKDQIIDRIQLLLLLSRFQDQKDLAGAFAACCDKLGRIRNVSIRNGFSDCDFDTFLLVTFENLTASPIRISQARTAQLTGD